MTRVASRVNRIGQTLDLECAARLARLVRARQKQCWRNALTAYVMHVDASEPAAYVEGFAVSLHGLVVEHGWLDLGGSIVDPTPTWHRDARTSADDALPCYFPAVRYQHEDLRRAIKAAGRQVTLPIVHGDTWAGWRLDAYNDAQVQAYMLSFNQPRDVVRRFLYPNGCARAEAV